MGIKSVNCIGLCRTTDLPLAELSSQIERLDRLAREGDITATFDLAELYDNGSDKANRAKALELYTKAADEGHGLAQYKVGWSYLKGFYTDVDYKKVFNVLDNYRKAPNNC